MAPRVAAVFGSTGLVGGHSVRVLLADELYSHVLAIARRELPEDFTKAAPKAVPVVVKDLGAVEDLTSAVQGALGGKQVDDVFCCLGTTIKKAGSPDAFRKVDLEYVIASAQAGLKLGAKTFVLVTSVGATQRGNLYLKTKWEAEEAVKAAGYPSVHILRPSVLLGARQEKRFLEGLAVSASAIFNPLLFGGATKFRGIQAEKVAEAMVASAKSDKQGNHLYHYNEIMELAAKQAKPPAHSEL